MSLLPGIVVAACVCSAAATPSASAAVASLPLPRTPAAAATQAAKAAKAALSSADAPVRLQIQIHGEAVEEDGVLPVLSLCSQLVEVIGGDARWDPGKIHFFFDGMRAARAWQQQAPEAAACTRWDVLSADGETGRTGGDAPEMEPRGRLADDALLVLVAPCNRDRARAGREAVEAGKLESVQRLVCGAQQVPIILVNPDLEALLVTQRLGRTARPPMFLSDFEHAFFLAEAQAKIGYITAVRRVWGRAWEVYRVEADEADGDAAGAAADSGGRRRRGVAPAALERTTLAHCCEHKPRSADMLAAYARRRRGARPELPGRTTQAAWAADEGWGLSG